MTGRWPGYQSESVDQTQTDARSRTFSWTDPGEIVAHVAGLGGLAALRALIGAELAPPVMSLLGMEDFTVGEGVATVSLTPREYHYNPLGTVHGGILATLLDTAAACAVHSTLTPGEAYTSLDLNTKFLRPVTVESARLRCEGRVLSRGRRTALAEARLTDAAGRLVAHATSSCLVFDAP